MSLIRQALMIPVAVVMLGVGAVAVQAEAPARQDVESFLEVTGFDVALESIRLSADAAPQMLGLEAKDFGSEWQRLVGEVFEKELMHNMALNILENTLTDELLTHAADFYASDLGQRLVQAENSSHLIEEDGVKSESGGQIVEGLKGINSPRVAILERLNAASGSEDSSLRSIQEVQIRFLMAAAWAGVVELQMDEPDLREAMRSQEADIRSNLRQSALEGAAYTYQAFSDAEMEDYAAALEHPKMKKVYELMNAVQYEVMADRFEVVAGRLREMQPSQDL
ncbi:hypothetical protein GGR95_002071 [Sulfitobacter undariae]|uniref:DUF2059 domain-containing protein n=1 Tax=Sulfitobacter undariae TaxID=1563671 RepID=A0A7W6E9F4_9RHOB|nr:DUF2059 domain-containing protein [Sulfitobacter undariae]MBB3994425.1 hypothetical protein [Sulfitobacter undariae]